VTNGDVLVNLRVPYEYGDEATALRKGYGLALIVEIKRKGRDG
jgi:hypothetical protein